MKVAIVVVLTLSLAAKWAIPVLSEEPQIEAAAEARAAELAPENLEGALDGLSQRSKTDIVNIAIGAEKGKGGGPKLAVGIENGEITTIKEGGRTFKMNGKKKIKEKKDKKKKFKKEKSLEASL